MEVDEGITLIEAELRDERRKSPETHMAETHMAEAHLPTFYVLHKSITSCHFT